MAHGDGRPADPLDSRLSQRILRLRSSGALGKALLRLVDQMQLKEGGGRHDMLQVFLTVVVLAATVVLVVLSVTPAR